MAEHYCIHEEDFGTIFERMKSMSESFDAQKESIDKLLKYMYEREAINDNQEKRGFSSRQKAGLYISAIFGISGIICMIILKFF